MSVLRKQDIEFFNKNGYVVARQVISREQCERTATAVWNFAGMDPADPETWYHDPPQGIMIEIYHHQTLWDNRTAPRVHDAFTRIWKTDKLWVSHDRASISPPNREPDAPESNLHWDVNLDNRPVPFGVQGVLYLTDTPAEQGAFFSVPGFHRRLDRWLDSLPPDADPKKQDLLALGARRIPAAAGDLIIWRTALPHMASLNRGAGPRVAQYITMTPATENDESRDQRITFWHKRLSGLGRYAKEREHHESPTATLTPLGRKLTGVDHW